MSEEQKAQARAAGAFDTFKRTMQAEMEARNRSPQYIAEFWDNLRNVAFDFATEVK